MNVAKTAVLLLLPWLVMATIPGQVWGQGEARETTLRRNVPRDAETMVGSVAMRVVSYLNISPAPSSLVDLSHDLVHEGLSERYFEGQNMASEYWAGSIMIGYRHWLPTLSAERST